MAVEVGLAAVGVLTELSVLLLYFFGTDYILRRDGFRI